MIWKMLATLSSSFFLKQARKQHVQYDAILVKNNFIYVVG